jgi:hypothetical protein
VFLCMYERSARPCRASVHGFSAAGFVGHGSRDVLFSPSGTLEQLEVGSGLSVCCLSCAVWLCGCGYRPAAVGLTDQWVHQRLSNQHYELWYRQLSDTVASADANFAAQQQQNQQRHGRGSERVSEGGSGKQPVSTPRLVAAKDYRCAGLGVSGTRPLSCCYQHPGVAWRAYLITSLTHPAI